MNGVAEQFESFTAAVTRAYKCLQKIKNRETERMGLKGSHVMCLYYIGKTPGGLTAAELCRLCHEDKAAISRTLVDLTGRGYLEPNVACVSGLQEIYKIRPGFSFRTDCKNASSLPLLGGSINTTSACSPCPDICTINFPASAV